MSGRYQIVIKGYLDRNWSDWFDGLRVSYDEQDNTVLSGLISDQPALYGILDRLRDMNLTLITVMRIGPDTDPFEIKEGKT